MSFETEGRARTEREEITKLQELRTQNALALKDKQEAQDALEDMRRTNKAYESRITALKGQAIEHAAEEFVSMPRLTWTQGLYARLANY